MKALPRATHGIQRALWRLTRPTTVGVRLILVKENTVLLVKHTYDDRWYLPGGGVKKGESVERAARREAAEELGATLGTLHLVGVYSSFFEHKNDHVIVLSCQEWEADGRRSREIERQGLFRLDGLPVDVSPGTRRRLVDYRDRAGMPVVGSW